MNVLIIDNGSRHTDKIEKFFGGWNIRRLAYDDPAIHETDEGTLAVLSGGYHKSVIAHREEYANEFEFVRNFGGPIIGICLGFEIIAHVHGNWLTRLDEKVVGVQKVEATDEGVAMGLPQEMSVYEAHRWALADVDEPLTVLARSPVGVEAFRHADRPLYGTQFHPELDKGADGAKIFRLLVDHAISATQTTSMI